MGRKKDILSLSVPHGTKERLEALAAELQIFWGDKPSPSGLVTAIAENRVQVASRFQLDGQQADALAQAFQNMVDGGFVDQARTILALLLGFGDLPDDRRQTLLGLLGQASAPWRGALDAQIQARQPFLMYYVSGAGHSHEFHVRFARMGTREGRSYLEIWADETQMNKDLPELSHNYVLRLDRVSNLVVLPAGGTWHDGLDAIEATMRLTGPLAQEYKLTVDDVADETDAQGVRRVRRQVTSTYWFIREVLAYGDQCLVEGPEPIVRRIRDQLGNLGAGYGWPAKARR